MENTIEYIKNEISSFYNNLPYQIYKIKGDGSERQYYRISQNNQTHIVVYSKNIEQNKNYFSLTEILTTPNIIIPQIYFINKNKDIYIVSDLGQKNLAEKFLEWSEFEPEKILNSYKKLIQIIHVIHQLHLQKTTLFFQNRVYNKERIQKDIEYFLKSFIQTLSAHDLILDQTREAINLLVSNVSQIEQTGIILKDFQSRNIMWSEGKLAIIDFQDAQYGSLFYDIASLLYASQSFLNEKQRKTILEEFYQLEIFNHISQDEFYIRFYQFVLLRRIRSFGTYGELGLKKQKQSFYHAIDPAFESIQYLLNNEYLKQYKSLIIFFQKLSVRWKQYDVKIHA